MHATDLRSAKRPASISFGRAVAAKELAKTVGQRAGDLTVMAWGRFDAKYTSVAQDKGGARLTIYRPAKLQAYLGALRREERHIFAKILAEPISYSQLEKDFSRVRAAIGSKALPYSMHGRRYVAAVKLAEAGCSDAEIQSVTGQKAFEIVQKHR